MISRPRTPAERAAISNGLRLHHASKPPQGMGLRELVARSAPEECPFCGDPRAQNATGRKAITCGDEICRRAYHIHYGRDRRLWARAFTGSTAGTK
jgi:hypothetical protein